MNIILAALLRECMLDYQWRCKNTSRVALLVRADGTLKFCQLQLQIGELD